MRSRVAAAACSAALLTWLPVVAAPAAHAAGDGAVFTGPRAAAPVVLTGAQIPQWAAPAATTQGLAAPYPVGGNKYIDQTRSAHNGYLVVPALPKGQLSVDPDTVAAYTWTGSEWKQIPVQVDQRFPYFLSNGHSDFGVYSGTDEELTYAWAPDSHDVGEEAWKKVFGGIAGADDASPCTARYELPGAAGDAEMAKAQQTPQGANYPAVNQSKLPAPPGPINGTLVGPPDDYRAAMQDPQPLFDTDDELSFMAGDAGQLAPPTTPAPLGTSNGETVSIADPLHPSNVGYVYLFTQPGGSTFKVTEDASGTVDSNSGYVTMQRDANADQWNDRYAYNDDDPNKMGTSNTGYGPNIPGMVCRTSSGNLHMFPGNSDGDPRPSTDRTPLDGMTVTTPTYQLHARGRWLIDSLRVKAPGASDYGPNIIARWKGRAFQQNPDSTISVVGFEDEQVNWEMNSALLGWRNGPVRAIREVWGADSGTNVTKTETYYRSADVYGYHVRVHPIPPDGLYTDWDYRPGVATTYYNMKTTADGTLAKTDGGVAIDGHADTQVGEVDSLPVTGQPAYTNVCDPTSQLCSAIDVPEEVAGPGFGLVYEFEMTGATGLAGNMAATPYYRDDACFDDGTGDAPVQRPYPKESSSDSRVHAGYLAFWQKWYDDHLALAQEKVWARPATYSDLVCQPVKGLSVSPLDPAYYENADTAHPPWKYMPFQGAIAEHGIHFFVTQDSDNTFSPKNTDEVDGQQWRYEVPMGTPTNVLTDYGDNVSAKLVAATAPFGSVPGSPGPSVPEVPVAVLLPAIGALVLWLVVRRRRRSDEPTE